MTVRRFGFVLALPIAAFAAGCEKPQAEITQPSIDSVDDPRDNTTGPTSDVRDRTEGGAAPAGDKAGSPESGAPDADAAAIEVRPVTPAELEQAIAGHKGKAVLVDYWATWCVPCRKQFPHTVALSKKYEADQLAVLSVSMDEPDQVADIKSFLAKQGGRLEHFVSSQGGAQEAFEAFAIGDSVPHYKIYGRDGSLVADFGSESDASSEAAKIDAAVEKAVGGGQT